ncbi:HupE/UreJ family protein [Pontixanthobacter aquaemixtae]|uniref:HupE/UreJ family protein n=1 Tax=Pontixanthobacter aquaemixtae TaxID=1958940 RepID=A0A844ZVD1_9SPHN|nr:HupE/UreJ family protein [Pontixanthobacter aquaemixtae]MXO91698.1 HupE/UreJ family protein [Pontixanthobacter aquaemixtae]
MRFLACLFAALAAAWALLPATAQADELRPGYLELTEQSQGVWQLSWKQTFTKPPAETPAPPLIPEPCDFEADPQIGAAQGAVIGSATLRCSAPLGGQSIAMPGLIGQSDMLVRVQPLGEPVQALRLTAKEPTAAIAAQPDTFQVLRTYFIIGVEHILAGWDHLLFVIALVLLIKNWRAVILAATAFTIAHSITLAVAALGYVGLPQAPVEALIALSILFLALEILRPEGEKLTLTRRFPWVVAFLFGLLHGFGFAGALNSIGLPEEDILAALLAFNIGVEAGQLLVIAVLLALLAVLRRMAVQALAPTVRFSAYGIGIIGAYWLVDRVIA